LTYTDARLREIVSRHLRKSALYGGAISSRGPRYCPSIEDKIIKFPAAERHQVFLEPEGLDTTEMYVNGLSTSLPPDVQLEFLRAVPGLEHVRMTRAGYAIEYDYFPPTQLKPTLETKLVTGLFLAGQVNGTTGYEEAAGQGVVAGLNAAAAALGLEEVVFGREQAYIGVLVDDLVSRGVDEPYRLFTSRSEYRLLLRQDNALRRLFPIAGGMGLLSSDERSLAEERLRAEEEIRLVAESAVVTPAEVNPVLVGRGSPEINEPRRIAELARRPEVPLLELLGAVGNAPTDRSHEWADIELKYAGYLAKEQSAAARLAQMDGFPMPEFIEYRSLHTLSFEAREKLESIRPESLGQASRIPGVSPSDLQSLVLEVLKYRRAVDQSVSRETVEGRETIVSRETAG
jgi:tRNA uridine 5-carboxymethylaminomethyl modification enzyme